MQCNLMTLCLMYQICLRRISYISCEVVLFIVVKYPPFPSYEMVGNLCKNSTLWSGPPPQPPRSICSVTKHNAY